MISLGIAAVCLFIIALHWILDEPERRDNLPSTQWFAYQAKKSILGSKRKEQEND